MTDEDIVINADKIAKQFKLPHERTTSLKGAFTGAMHGKNRHSVENQTALKEISFKIKRGEFFGIVGRNGSGKSTLLKILAGIYQPSSGEVTIEGKLVPFIELGVGFNPELTGKENVYLNGALLGFSRKEVAEIYAEIVSFAELERFMDQKLKNYSSGMQVRLAFSMAIRANADILLIDEVLAVGDADFQRKCYDYFKKLKGSGKTVVFISHDMQAVREYCDRAILIEAGLVKVMGDVTRVAHEYTQMFMVENVYANKEAGVVRWGEGGVKYKKPSTEISLNTIKIKAVAEITKDLEDIILGFTVKGADDVDIMGTNTRIKQRVIKQAAKGEQYILEWEFPNILEDGEYKIALTAHGSSGLPVYDWWSTAGSISVRKAERTGYAISPDIQLVMNKEK